MDRVVARTTRRQRNPLPILRLLRRLSPSSFSSSRRIGRFLVPVAVMFTPALLARRRPVNAACGTEGGGLSSSVPLGVRRRSLRRRVGTGSVAMEKDGEARMEDDEGAPSVWVRRRRTGGREKGGGGDAAEEDGDEERRVLVCAGGGQVGVRGVLGTESTRWGRARVRVCKARSTGPRTAARASSGPFNDQMSRPVPELYACRAAQRAPPRAYRITGTRRAFAPAARQSPRTSTGRPPRSREHT